MRTHLDLGTIEKFLNILKTHNIVINVSADLETTMKAAAIRTGRDTVLAKTKITINAKQILFIFPEISVIIANSKELYAQ